MRSSLTLAPILLLSACIALPSQGPSAAEESATPSAALVDRIEVALAKNQCVGSLDRWARHYRWQDTTHGPRRDIVEVDLRQAGVFGYRQGRYVLPNPDPRIGPGEVIVTGDDRRYLVAFASYDVRRDRLTMEICGSNKRD